MTQNAELAASLRQIMKVLEQMAELAKENQSLSENLEEPFPRRPLQTDDKYRSIYNECYRSSLKHENEAKVEREPLEAAKHTRLVGMPLFLILSIILAYAFLIFRYLVLQGLSQASSMYSEQLASSPIWGLLEPLNKLYPNEWIWVTLTVTFILAAAAIYRAKKMKVGAGIAAFAISFWTFILPPSVSIPAAVTALVACILTNSHRKTKKQDIKGRNDERNRRYADAVAEAKSQDKQLAEQKASKLVQSVLHTDEEQWALECKEKLSKQENADKQIRRNVKRMAELQEQYFKLTIDDNGDYWYPPKCATIKACKVLIDDCENDTLNEKSRGALWAHWLEAKRAADLRDAIDKQTQVNKEGFQALQQSLDGQTEEIKGFVASFEDGMLAVTQNLEDITAGQRKTQQQIDEAIDQIDRGLEHAYSLSMTAMNKADEAFYRATMAGINASYATARTYR